MSRVLAIAAKDLRSTFRNLPALVMMLAAPLALSALLGLAFGGAGGFSIAAAKVALANLDRGASAAPTTHGGTAGDLVAGVLRAPGLKDVLAVSTAATAEAARKKVDDGEAAVAVVIPADFSRVVHGASAATTAVDLYRNPTYDVGGAVTESVVGRALLAFNGARAAAAAAQGLATASGRGAGEAAAAAQRAAAAFVRDAEHGSAGLVLAQRPPRLAGGEKSEDVGVTGVVLAGMMIFFMFFGASNVARTILTEEQDGTLARLFTTPSPRRTVIGGKFASTFATVLVQGVLLVIGGLVFFGIDWGAPAPVALLVLAASAVAAGLGLLVISLVRTPGQAGAIGSGVYLVLALLGGNFTGSAQAGGTYAVVQRLTPNGWLLAGWNTTMRGGGVADIVPALLVTLAFCAVFFALAMWRFRRRFA